MSDNVSAEYRDESGNLLWKEERYQFKRMFASGQTYNDPSGKAYVIISNNFVGVFGNGVIFYVVRLLTWPTRFSKKQP